MRRWRSTLLFSILPLLLAALVVSAVRAQAPQPPAQPPVPIGNLSLQNASLVEVIDQLARQLHINYILDPAVKGGVVMNTYGSTANLDARNLLDLILRINGAAMVQEGEIYRILPLKDAPRMPLRPQVNARDIPEDDQLMLNLVFLKYVTVEELTKVITEFTGENATLYSYAPSNLLFILDSRRNMRRTMELIQLFDSDTFANQRVRLFEVHNTRPSDLVKDLDSVLKAVSLDGKGTTVRFLPVDRINTLIAVAPNPGVFDTIEEWLKKLDVPVKIAVGGGSENHVYRLRYGRADCIASALSQLYGFATPGGYGGGYRWRLWGGGGYRRWLGYGGGGGGAGYGGSGFGYPNTAAASGGGGSAATTLLTATATVSITVLADSAAARAGCRAAADMAGRGATGILYLAATQPRFPPMQRQPEARSSLTRARSPTPRPAPPRRPPKPSPRCEWWPIPWTTRSLSKPRPNSIRTSSESSRISMCPRARFFSRPRSIRWISRVRSPGAFPRNFKEKAVPTAACWAP